jgi:ribosomal protein S18 acetylase RimI-like enzyme
MDQDLSEKYILPVRDELSTDIYLCYREAFSGPPLPIQRFKQVYIEHLAYDSRYSFVYKKGHQVQAFLLVRLFPDASLYITLCGVRKGYRRKGLMNHLVCHMENAARLNGVTTIFLDILYDNFPAMSAFNKWGYAQKSAVFTFDYKGETLARHILLEENTSREWAGINAFDSAFTEGFLRYDASIPGEGIVGRVVLDPIRKQIVHVEIYQEKRGRGYGKELISRVVKETGCRYVFRVGEPGIKSFLLKVGFESILEQIVLSKT